MVALNLRRFSEPAALRAIRPDRLLQLLSPHRDFFALRRAPLPPDGSEDGLNYEQLVDAFMTPDNDTPDGLANSLYLIHEMATQEGMDALLPECRTRGIPIDGGTDPTPADVAVQVWLADRVLLERKHAEQCVNRPRSFEYYRTVVRPLPEFTAPSGESREALEKALDEWFVPRRRGPGSRVFVFPKPDAVWFLVSHGQPFERKGVLEEGKAATLFFRGETHDVLAYDRFLGELRVHASSKGDKDTYRMKFGQYFFGSEAFFGEVPKYTLAPLLVKGAESLLCNDIPGMEWVKLRQIEIYWGGPQHDVDIRKADDLFASFKAREYSLPANARLTRASFQVKFRDAKAPRMVTVRPPKTTQYTRDDDSEVVEEWLRERQFVLTGR